MAVGENILQALAILGETATAAHGTEAQVRIDAIRRQQENDGGILNGHPDRRLAHNLNMRFDGIES